MSVFKNIAAATAPTGGSAPPSWVTGKNPVFLGSMPAGMQSTADKSLLSQLGKERVQPTEQAFTPVEMDAAAVTQQAQDALQTGMGDVAATLDPDVQRAQQYSEQLQNLLMGQTPIETLPGYDAMVAARQEGVGDLATMMGGAGKLFSGTTAEGAADIGGALQNQLMQQTIANLMGAAQPGQQMTSQLAGYRMGTGQQMAQLPFQQAGLDLQTQGMNIQQQQFMEDLAFRREQYRQALKEQAAANKSGFMGDLLGGLGTVGGFMLGGPVGAAAGGAIGGAVGSSM